MWWQREGWATQARKSHHENHPSTVLSAWAAVLLARFQFQSSKISKRQRKSKTQGISLTTKDDFQRLRNWRVRPTPKSHLIDGFHTSIFLHLVLQFIHTLFSSANQLCQLVYVRMYVSSSNVFNFFFQSIFFIFLSFPNSSLFMRTTSKITRSVCRIFHS